VIGVLAAAALCALAACLLAPPLAAAPKRPYAIKLLVNGKPYKLVPLSGSDVYIPIRPGRLRVEARWTGDLAGTGYYVRIGASESLEGVLGRCFSGTSCVVTKPVPLGAGQELSLTAKILVLKNAKVVEGGRVCLEGAK
jgi:hypothetical protein